MPWVRFDDNFDDTDDIDKMSDSAIALHVCGTTWSARNLTDGFIPESRIKKLPGGSSRLAIKQLLFGEKPWWIKVENGYQIRSFLKYNPSGIEFLERREQISKARSEAGKNGAQKRWDHGKSDGKQYGKPDSKSGVLPLENNGKTMANGMAKVVEIDGKKMAPNPESRNTRTTSTQKNPNTHGVPVDADALFEAFAQEYPKRNSDLCKAAAKKRFIGKFRDPTLAAQIIEGAKRYHLAMIAQGKVGTHLVCQMPRWLDEQRWTEEYSAEATSPPKPVDQEPQEGRDFKTRSFKTEVDGVERWGNRPADSDDPSLPFDAIGWFESRNLPITKAWEDYCQKQREAAIPGGFLSLVESNP